MGGRVHPLKRSVSWVNSVQRQFLAYGPILFLVPVSEATPKINRSRRVIRKISRPKANSPMKNNIGRLNFGGINFQRQQMKGKRQRKKNNYAAKNNGRCFTLWAAAVYLWPAPIFHCIFLFASFSALRENGAARKRKQMAAANKSRKEKRCKKKLADEK